MEGIRLSVDTSTTSTTGTTTSDSSSDDEASIQYNGLKRKINDSFDSCYEESPKVPRIESSYSDYHNTESEDNEKASQSSETSHTFSYNTCYKSDEDSEHDSEKVSVSSFHQQSQANRINHFDSNQSDYKDSHQSQNDSSKTNFGWKIMQKLGYKQGKGLGKKLQGRSEPVQASTQKGTRGLGLELPEFEKASLDFRPEEEEVKVVEDIEWLINEYPYSVSDEDLIAWKSKRKEGKSKRTIDGETTFCDENIVKGIIDSKTMFDNLDKNEMREARTRSNPYETIRGAIFLNRAAVKMANIDKACDFAFTKAANQGVSDSRQKDLLYFADVCAGPGGFSEYVLWRTKWRAKGFGFTLKESNDFKLEDFIAGSSSTFHPYYGPAEDGDVYNPKNQKALKELVMSQTDNHGVHFMMADGGFSVEGLENIQEILSKQLYLCQCLVALMIVRPGGHFVTKLFDLFTPFSAGLVYIMYRCFEKISIFKPNTSRPANSERYLICLGKKSNIDNVIDYLFDINKKLCESSKTVADDILEIVPVENLLLEKEFFKYLKSSNDLLGQKQIIGLKKIAYYAENKTKFETRQAEMREKCLAHWEVPSDARVLPKKTDPQAKVNKLLDNTSKLPKIDFKNVRKLTKDFAEQIILPVSPFDHFCMPLAAAGDTEPTFYLGMERSAVYKYDKGQWKKSDKNIELPCGTLVYAEMITEYKREGMGQLKTDVLHILDAFSLGTENISRQVFPERHRCLKLFCKALWKPDKCFRKDTPAPVRVRCKELIALNDIDSKLNLVPKLMKGSNKGLEKAFLIDKQSFENDEDELFYIPKNILFFSITKSGWHYVYSRGRQDFYFYNDKNQKTCWAIQGSPPNAVKNFLETVEYQILWTWPSDNSFSLKDFMELKQSCSK